MNAMVWRVNLLTEKFKFVESGKSEVVGREK